MLSAVLPIPVGPVITTSFFTIHHFVSRKVNKKKKTAQITSDSLEISCEIYQLSPDDSEIVHFAKDFGVIIQFAKIHVNLFLLIIGLLLHGYFFTKYLNRGVALLEGDKWFI